MTKLDVRVLSPEGALASTEATEVNLPALYGYVGLRPTHTPMIAQIGVGTLEIKDSGKEPSVYFVSGGYFELLDDNLTLLVDIIEEVGEIDHDRANKSVDRALRRLNESQGLDIDIPRALASLERAKARRKLVEIHKN